MRELPSIKTEIAVLPLDDEDLNFARDNAVLMLQDFRDNAQPQMGRTIDQDPSKHLLLNESILNCGFAVCEALETFNAVAQGSEISDKDKQQIRSECLNTLKIIRANTMTILKKGIEGRNSSKRYAAIGRIQNRAQRAIMTVKQGA